MKDIKIYTAGKMSGISYEWQMGWRRSLENCLRAKTPNVNLSFIHPPLYYNYEFKSHNTEAELKEWELNQLRDCDIMVVNLEDIGTSIGSHFELGFANAMNMFGGKHIFIIGIGNDDGLHPWIRESIFRREPDVHSAVEYINSYLLV